MFSFHECEDDCKCYSHLLHMMVKRLPFNWNPNPLNTMADWDSNLPPIQRCSSPYIQADELVKVRSVELETEILGFDST